MRTTSRVSSLFGLIAVMVSASVLPLGATAQTSTCTDYSSQAAAQFALEMNPGLTAALDPDGNSIACDNATGAPHAPSSTQQQPQQKTDILGITRTNIEAVYGQPTREIVRANDPNTTSAAYVGSGTTSEFFVVYYNDRAIILLLQAVQSWTPQEAANVIAGFVPADITSLPQPEQIMEGTFLTTVNSPTLASSPTVQQVVTNAGLPGVPGDMYVLLTTSAEQEITDIEIGLGNGDNVREELTGSQATTGPTPPIITTTPATGTTTESMAFLQQVRTEVDQHQAEITELSTILDGASLTQADITRVYEIVDGWIALDTTPITAPPEHAAIATQLTAIRVDLSTAGEIIFMMISIGDTSRTGEAAAAINRAELNLTTLDQNLTDLGA